MLIKSLIVVDESGKEFAFTHRSFIEVTEYEAAKDPEVQGTGLAEIITTKDTSTPTVEPLKEKRKYTKKK